MTNWSSTNDVNVFDSSIAGQTLANYATQQQFNTSMIQTWGRQDAVNERFKQLISKNGNNIIANSSNLSQVSDLVSTLQNSLSTLQKSFSSLQSDNGTFKTNVTSQIAGFQSVLDSFQGQLTALQSEENTNASAISTLKTQLDPALLKEAANAWSSVQGAINSYDTGTVQPALSKLATSFTSLQTSVTNLLNTYQSEVNQQVQNLSTQMASLSSNQTSFQGEVTAQVNGVQQQVTTNANNLKAEQQRAQAAEDRANNRVDQLNQTLNENVNTINIDLQNMQQNISTTAQQTREVCDSDSKSYTDAQIETVKTVAANNLAEAKGYADTGDSNTLASSKTYTDSQISPLDKRVEASENVSSSANNISNEALSEAQTALAKATANKTALDQEVSGRSQACQVLANNLKSITDVVNGIKAVMPQEQIIKGSYPYSDAYFTASKSSSGVTVTAAKGCRIFGTLSNGYAYLDALSITSAAQFTVYGDSGYENVLIDTSTQHPCFIIARVECQSSSN